MTALSDQCQQLIWRGIPPPISIKIKSLYTGLFAPNHRIWLARGLLAHKILAAIHQIRRALAGLVGCFARSDCWPDDGFFLSLSIILYMPLGIDKNKTQAITAATTTFLKIFQTGIMTMAKGPDHKDNVTKIDKPVLQLKTLPKNTGQAIKSCVITTLMQTNQMDTLPRRKSSAIGR